MTTLENKLKNFDKEYALCWNFCITQNHKRKKGQGVLCNDWETTKHFIAGIVTLES